MDQWHYGMEYMVSSTDTDAAYEYRPSALFVLLQKAITTHAKLLGADRDDVLPSITATGWCFGSLST